MVKEAVAETNDRKKSSSNSTPAKPTKQVAALLKSPVVNDQPSAAVSSVTTSASGLLGTPSEVAEESNRKLDEQTALLKHLVDNTEPLAKAEVVSSKALKKEEKEQAQPTQSTGGGILSDITGAASDVIGNVASKGAGGLAKGAGGLVKGAGRLLGKVALPLAAGMAVVDGISGYQKASESLDIKGREATTGEKMSSAAGSVVSGLTFGLLSEKTASKGIANFFGAGPDKATPTAEPPASADTVYNQSAENAGSGTKATQTPIIVNAPATVSNSVSTNVNRSSPRNNDSTAKDFIRSRYAGA